MEEDVKVKKPRKKRVKPEELSSLDDLELDSFVEPKVSDFNEVASASEDMDDDVDADLEDVNYDMPEDEVSQQQLNVARDMQVQLFCQIGQLTFTLKELLDLKVGDVFSIGSLPPVVRLMSNNQCFGEGILVEVDGQLGIKLIGFKNNESAHYEE